MGIDFEAAGLLDGLDDEPAREARRELLDRLEADGVSLEELREAVGGGRLALLPVERIFTSDLRYSAREIAERTGLEIDFVLAVRQAQGLVGPDPDERAFTEEELQGAHQIVDFRSSGLGDDAILEVTRVLGQGMAQLASAMHASVEQAFAQSDLSELELAQRYARAARELSPRMQPLMEIVLGLHEREHVRQAVVGAELDGGGMPGVREVVVCFADLVGFTRLGEEVPAEELGTIVGRLQELASAVVSSEVDLVKTIGDAAMLVSPDPDALLRAALALVEAADAEGESFPQLRAGLAAGEALERGGDWYGRPVNLASRVTGIARPGSVLATEPVHDASGDGFRWSRAGRRRVKGVKGEVTLFRARPAETDGSQSETDGGRSSR